MSITIASQPPSITTNQSLQSANNTSPFVVNSTLSNQTDYTYVCDVYINGAKSVTLKSYPDPQYGYGVFDLNSVTNKFVSFDFPGTAIQNSVLSPTLAANSSCQVQLKFKENYVSGNTFISQSGTTDSGIYSYLNSSLSFIDSINNTYLNNYIISNSQFHSGKFLQTIKPINNIITKDAPKTLRQWLYFFEYPISGTTIPYVHITTYDNSGTLIGSYVLTNYATTTVPSVLYISVGYPQLDIPPGPNYTTISGPSKILGSSVMQYQVLLNYSPTDYTATAYSDIVRFNIKDECTKFTDTYSVYWLNELGGFDSFRFAKRNVTTFSKNQSSYKKIQGTLNSNGSYTRNTYDPSTINYYTEVTTAIQLNSDWINDNQVDFLKGLFSSPAIFIEDSSGVIQAVTVNDKDYVLNRTVNGTKAYSLQITLTISSINYRQLL